jgi:hypothetical protein
MHRALGKDGHGARRELVEHKTRAVLREQARPQCAVHAEVDFRRAGMLFYLLSVKH